MKIPRPTASPWKNGQGLTRQIAIEPTSSQFSSNDFKWRMSNAVITGDNSFSQFPNYDRWLMVWKGAGLLINGSRLEPFVPLEFKGESHIECKVIAGDVEDLGVIYQRGSIPPRAHVLRLEKSIFALPLKQGTHFLFCAQGSVEVGGVKLLEGESFSLSGEHSQVHIAPLLPAILIAITLA